MFILFLKIFQQQTLMNRLESISEKIVVQQNQHKHIYAVPIGPKVKGETQAYRRPDQVNGFKSLPTDITSLANFWDRSVRLYPNNKFIQDFTYREVDEIAKRVGSWILDRGHKLFFMYCLSSPEWTITDVATMNYGLINVALYDTLGAEAFSHILKITQGTLIFTTKNMSENLLNFLTQNKFCIREVCFFDGVDVETKKKLSSLGLKVTLFSELLDYKQVRERPPTNLDSVVTYMFTSGTTGIPKGVTYTHRMVATICFAMIGHYQLTSTDVHLSFLPIAHAFERYNIWSCIFFGANVRYSRHPISQLLKELAICRPTTLPMVPRLLNKFYPVMKEMYEKDGNYERAKNMFGGRVRLMVTGSAPVSPDILTFYKVALGADLRQGYGQTETSAASFITVKGDIDYGHVGGPNSVTQFKLVDVPQMNYFTDGNEPKGEICLRGPTMFPYYFKDPKNTSETLDKEGWNHTGDIGIVLANGSLKIIDRKKNIYKLQQGEYVAPEKIENVYARCKFVAETFVYGDSLRDFSVAIVHPNLEALPSVAQSLGIQEQNVEALCANPKINAFILGEMQKQGQNDGLMSFEQAKRIRLWPAPFQKVGILTSSMKLQRHIAKEIFKNELVQLYKQQSF